MESHQSIKYEDYIEDTYEESEPYEGTQGGIIATAASVYDCRSTFISRLRGLSNSMNSPSPSDRPRVLGIHHLKFAVSNLGVSLAWYERVLGARRIATLDHIRSDGTRFAAVCQLPEWSGLYVELRQTPEQAIKDRGWDPITLSVQGKRDLEKWIEWLERWKTVHSPLLTGVRGWLLVFEDPDGRRIRMYTREDHGGMETASRDEYWLKEI